MHSFIHSFIHAFNTYLLLMDPFCSFWSLSYLSITSPCHKTFLKCICNWFPHISQPTSNIQSTCESFILSYCSFLTLLSPAINLQTFSTQVPLHALSLKPLLPPSSNLHTPSSFRWQLAVLANQCEVSSMLWKLFVYPGYNCKCVRAFWCRA